MLGSAPFANLFHKSVCVVSLIRVCWSLPWPSLRSSAPRIGTRGKGHCSSKKKVRPQDYTESSIDHRGGLEQEGHRDNRGAGACAKKSRNTLNTFG